MDWVDNIGSWLSDHNPAELISSGIGKLVSGIFSIMASLVNDAVASVVKDVATVWMKVPSPDLSGGGERAVSPSDMSGLTTILAWAKWVGFAVAGIALILVFIRFAVMASRGETIQFTSRVMMVLFGVVAIGAAAGMVGSIMGPGPVSGGGTAAKIQSHLWVYMLVLASVSVIAGAVKMMWQADARPGRDTLGSILKLVVVAGAGTSFIQLCITMGDSFSDWILKAAANGDFGATLVKTMVFSVKIPGGPILILIVGLLCMLASVFQVIVMICRSGMLVVLTGMLPLAAAAMNTEAGKNWANKSMGWLVAFLLYKPVASIIYATCFWMVGGGAFGSDSGSLVNVLVGFAFMLMCLFALPALMKACVPAVGALTSGSGSGGGMAAAAPTGAMLMASGFSGGGGSSGGTAPSGSSSAAGAGAGGGSAAAGAAGGGVGLAATLGAKALEKGKQAMDQGIGGGSESPGAGSGPDGAKPMSGPSSSGSGPSDSSGVSGEPGGYQAGTGTSGSGPSGSSRPPADADGGGYGQPGQPPSGMNG